MATRTPQNNRFNCQNNRSARALCVFVHFFAVLCKTTTWNDQIQGFVENVSTRRRILHSPSLLEPHSYQFSSQILRPHCTSWTNWNNRKVVEVTRSYFFKWRFRCRCRRRCLSSPLLPKFSKKLKNNFLYVVYFAVLCTFSLASSLLFFFCQIVKSDYWYWRLL